MLLAPYALPAHGRVGVFAPSGAFNPEKLEQGLAVIRGWGLEPVLAPNLGRRHRFLAGTDEERLHDLHWALSAPDLDAAWMARGGYGITRILRELKWGNVPSRPVLGFSDGTALFVRLWQKSRRLSVHAPVLHNLAAVDAESQEHLRRFLFCEPVGPLPARVLVPGEVSAPLIGGNLCTLTALCGTRDQLRPGRAILVLEDIGEPAYKVDRMLTQLRLAGCFERVAGVVIGELGGCTVPEGETWTVDELLLEHLGRMDVPVLVDAPIGHGARNRAFLFGGQARIGPEGLTLQQGLRRREPVRAGFRRLRGPDPQETSG